MIDHFKSNVRRMLMKNADLSNATRPHAIAHTWATRLAEEHFRQTEYDRDFVKVEGASHLFTRYETENHLTLTNDIFTRDTCNLARTQITFYDLFMREMLEEWVDFTGLEILQTNFHSNYSHWKASAGNLSA